MKLLISSLACLIWLPVFSQSLRDKSSFGTQGLKALNLGSDASMYNEAIARQSDGKLLLGGYGVIRVLSTGVIDSSFGTNGQADLTFYSNINSIEVQPDGKILAARVTDMDQLACLRFLSNGKRDSSFALNGEFVFNYPAHHTFCEKVKLQPDGKILLVGWSDSSSFSDAFVCRLNSNGTLDTGFNGTGFKILPLSAYADWAFDIGLQSDGKMIVTGSRRIADTTSHRLYVMRLMPNGAVDAGFNGTGLFEYISPSLSGGEFGRQLQVLSDNRILVSGSTNGQLLLIKLLANGAIDNSFGNAGFVMDSTGLSNLPHSLHIRPDNRILLTGVRYMNGDSNLYDFAAWQFLANGAADGGFGNAGSTQVPIVDNELGGTSALNPDGSFVISGSRYAPQLLHLAKIGSNGFMDIGFGNNGIAILQVRGSLDILEDLVRQTDGKLLVAGNKNDGEINKKRVAITRLNENGSVDNSFGNQGIFFHPDGSLFVQNMVLQPDNKILVSVIRTSYYPVFETKTGVFRLNSNGTIDNSFATGSDNLYLQDSMYGDYGPNLALQSDGKILLAGHEAFTVDFKIKLVRLNSDGTPDNSFGDQGVFLVPPDTSTNFIYAGIRLQPDGKILLGGDKEINDSTYRCFVMRLMNDGSFDPTFGDNGMETDIFPPSGYTGLYAMRLKSNGGIALTGTALDTGNLYSEVAMKVLKPDGSADSSFNGNGIKTIKNLSQGVDGIPYDLLVHADSSYYLVAETYDINTGATKNYALRIKPQGMVDSALSADGTGWRNIPGLGEINLIRAGADSTIYTGGNYYKYYDNGDFQVRAFTKSNGNTFRFSGNGNWSNPSLWSYGILPPAVLPPGSVIIIESGMCILSQTQTIQAGGSLVVQTGANLIIQGGLIITQ